MDSTTLPPPPAGDHDEHELRQLQGAARDLVLDYCQEWQPGPLRDWLLDIAGGMLDLTETLTDADAVDEQWRGRRDIRDVRSGLIGTGSRN